MNAETVDVVDCLVEELAVPVIIQLTKANRELRREHPRGKFNWKDSVDMDVVLMNFPFLN